MPRERKDFVRKSGFRDANLMVVACEGAVTEPAYFRAMREAYHTPRLHVEILHRADPSESSPAHVLSQIDAFRDTFNAAAGDQFWLVIDRDPQSWKPGMLASVATECQQRSYSLAVSVPCFELWLLLHFIDVPAMTPADRSVFDGKTASELKTLIGTHRLSHSSDFDICDPHTTLAIGRARQLDTVPGDRWPQTVGTHVYRLVEMIRGFLVTEAD